MRWVFYNSLKEGAKQALKRGTGKYRKYAVKVHRQNLKLYNSVMGGL